MPTIDPEKVTGSQLARIYGVTTGAVSHWVRRDGCPRNDDGTYSIAEVIQWREARLAVAASEVTAGGSPALERKRLAEAEMAEIKLGEQRGELIAVQEWRREQTAKIQIVKRALLSMPRRMAPLLQGLNARQIEGQLGEELRRVIAQFAGQRL